MNDRKFTRIIIYSGHATNWSFINFCYFISSKQTLVDSFSYVILNFWTEGEKTEQNEIFFPVDGNFLKTSHGFFWEKYLTYSYNIILSIIHLVNLVVCCHMINTSFFFFNCCSIQMINKALWSH